MRVSDRRRQGWRIANGARELPLSIERNRGAAVRLHPLVERSRCAAGKRDGLKASHDWVRWGFFFVAGSFKVGGRRAGMTGRLGDQTIHPQLITAMHIKKAPRTPS